MLELVERPRTLSIALNLKVRAPDLRHLAVNVLQDLVHSVELGDGVLVDLALLLHELLQLYTKRH